MAAARNLYLTFGFMVIIREQLQTLSTQVGHKNIYKFSVTQHVLANANMAKLRNFEDVFQKAVQLLIHNLGA
jgi:hypothetical protein